MHPLLTAAAIYWAHFASQPKYDGAQWEPWLDRAVELSDWFNTLRRLRF